MMTEVSATAISRLVQLPFVFLGTGTMLDVLKHVGTTECDMEKLNMSVNTPASML